jgi:hypothetical protein
MASARPPQAQGTTTCCTGVFASPRGTGAGARARAVRPEQPASLPRRRGCKKRALLVGISYAATKHELRGAVNSGGSRIDLRGGYKT